MPDGLAPYGWPVYRLHQQLIGLRRRHPWLHRARVRMIELRNTDLLFEAHHGDRRLFIALNLADAAVTRMLPSAVTPLVGELSVKRAANGCEIGIPAHGWGILEPGVG
jgi:hypothetical protein